MQRTLANMLLQLYKSSDLEDGALFTKKDSGYDSISRSEILAKALKLGDELKSLGLQKSSKAAIISENRVEWVITDIACILNGIITVPVYNSLSNEQIRYILNDSGAEICFCSNRFLLEKVIAVKEQLPALKHIVSFTDFFEDERIESIKYFSEMTSGSSAEKENTAKLEKLASEVNENDILTIIYTSGTTGEPKGVMLSHLNIYTNLKDCVKILDITEKDVFLSYLPYSHIYERVAGYYLAFFNAAKIYYAKNIDTIGVQMGEVKPTLIITVPRLLDKMYFKVLKAGDELSGIKKKLYTWGLKTAKEASGSRPLKWKLANMLVLKKIRVKTGGRIRYFVSGGGALNKETGKLFEGVGITTLEGYGMTETSPVISVNRPEKNKYGTVGPPLDSVQVKIADDGEILVKGLTVMQGYYNQPEDTAKTIVDGWLHTGDIGEIDSEGYIKITDRKKSLFKTSGGKYVAPAQIEDAILQLPYVEQVTAIGNGRMYVTALMVVNKDELKRAFPNADMTQNLNDNLDVRKHIEKDLARVQKPFGSFERVRKFTLLIEPFTIESGELTPTMKIKRKVVEEKYKDEIEQMYYEI